jgi:hypothetical protein
MKKKLYRWKFYLKIMLVTTLLYSSFRSPAQKISKAVEFASDVTGSGLGSNIYMGTVLTRGNSAFSLGASVQCQNFNLSGMQLNYRYRVAQDETKKLELFILANITLHGSAKINNRSIKTEQMCRNRESYNYKTLSLKVVEGYVGFGLKYNFSQRLNAICSGGFGAYETLNRDYDCGMYRQKSALSLRLQAGIIYNLK